MPNLDIIKGGMILVLVGAVVGLVGWFSTSVHDKITTSGALAELELSANAVAPWNAVKPMFGTGWSVAWDVALAVALAMLGLLFMFRVIKWVIGS